MSLYNSDYILDTISNELLKADKSNTNSPKRKSLESSHSNILDKQLPNWKLYSPRSAITNILPPLNIEKERKIYNDETEEISRTLSYKHLPTEQFFVANTLNNSKSSTNLSSPTANFKLNKSSSNITLNSSKSITNLLKSPNATTNESINKPPRFLTSLKSSDDICIIDTTITPLNIDANDVINENTLTVLLKPWLFTYLIERSSAKSATIFADFKINELNKIGGTVLAKFLPHPIYTFIVIDLIRLIISVLNPDLANVMTQLLNILISASYSTTLESILTENDIISLRNQFGISENVNIDREMNLLLTDKRLEELSPFLQYIMTHTIVAGPSSPPNSEETSKSNTTDTLDEVGDENEEFNENVSKISTDSLVKYSAKPNALLKRISKLFDFLLETPSKTSFWKKTFNQIFEYLTESIKGNYKYEDVLISNSPASGNYETHYTGSNRIRHELVKLVNDQSSILLKSTKSTDILIKVKELFKKKMDHSNSLSNRYLKRSVFQEWKFWSTSRRKNIRLVSHLLDKHFHVKHNKTKTDCFLAWRHEVLRGVKSRLAAKKEKLLENLEELQQMDRENRYSKFSERDKLVVLLNTMTASNAGLLLYRQKLIDVNKRKNILLENAQNAYSPYITLFNSISEVNYKICKETLNSLLLPISIRSHIDSLLMDQDISKKEKNNIANYINSTMHCLNSSLNHLNIPANKSTSPFCIILIFLISQLFSNSNLNIANIRALIGLNHNNKIENNSFVSYATLLIENIQKTNSNIDKEFIESPWVQLFQSPEVVLKAGLWIFQSFLNMSSIPASFNSNQPFQYDIESSYSATPYKSLSPVTRRVSILSPKNAQNISTSPSMRSPLISPFIKSPLISPPTNASANIPQYAIFLSQIRPNVWKKYANITSIDHVDPKVVRLLEISAPSNVLLKSLYLNFILNKKLDKKFESYDSITEDLYSAWINLAFPRLLADSDDCHLSLLESERNLRSLMCIDTLPNNKLYMDLSQQYKIINENLLKFQLHTNLGLHTIRELSIEEDALIQKLIVDFKANSNKINEDQTTESNKVEQVDPWSVRLSEVTIATLFLILLPESHHDDEELLLKEIDFCKSIYRKYQNQLRDFFLQYSNLNLMNAAQFLECMKSHTILSANFSTADLEFVWNYSSKNEKNQISFSAFVHCLLHIAFKKYGLHFKLLHLAFEYLILFNFLTVSSNIENMIQSFRLKVSSNKVQSVFQTHQLTLQHQFFVCVSPPQSKYAWDDSKPIFMDWENFNNYVIGLKIQNVSKSQLVDIFKILSKPVDDAKLLNFESFFVAIAALSYFVCKNPTQPLHEKFEIFIQIYLKKANVLKRNSFSIV